jgi:hypothetical protein
MEAIEAIIGADGQRLVPIIQWDLGDDGILLTEAACHRLEAFFANYAEATFGRSLAQFNSDAADAQWRMIRDFGSTVCPNLVAIRVAWNHLVEMGTRLAAFVLNPKHHVVMQPPCGVERFREWARRNLNELDPAIVADPLGEIPRNRMDD